MQYVAGHQREDVGAAHRAAAPAGRPRGLADGAGNPDESPQETRAHHRVFHVLEGHRSCFFHDLLQRAFLIGEVAGGVADNYQQEARTLHLPGELRQVVQVFLVVRGDVGSHHGGVKAHQRIADFRLADLSHGFERVLNILEGQVAYHEVGRHLRVGVLRADALHRESRRTRPVVNLDGSGGKDAESRQRRGIAPDDSPQGRTGSVPAEPLAVRPQRAQPDDIAVAGHPFDRQHVSLRVAAALAHMPQSHVRCQRHHRAVGPGAALVAGESALHQLRL